MKRTITILLSLVLLLTGGCTSTSGSASTNTVPADAVDFVDPNCTVTVVAGPPFAHPFAGLNAAQRADATNAIANLQFADLYRNPPFRINGPAGLVRLDVQGAIAGGGRNWQVQVNGVVGASTIATMLIAGTTAGASTPERRAFVQRSARNALVQSLGTGNTYNVNGVCQ